MAQESYVLTGKILLILKEPSEADDLKVMKPISKYRLKYQGDYPNLSDLPTFIEVYDIKGKIMYGICCPFCGKGMSSLDRDDYSIQKSNNSNEIADEKYKCNPGHQITLYADTKGDMAWK